MDALAHGAAAATASRRRPPRTPMFAKPTSSKDYTPLSAAHRAGGTRRCKGCICTPQILTNFLSKFINSEKATKFCKISTLDLSFVVHNGQIYNEDFAKFCGLLRIYELYDNQIFIATMYKHYHFISFLMKIPPTKVSYF